MDPLSFPLPSGHPRDPETQMAANEYFLRRWTERHQSLDSVDLCSLFLSRILKNLFLSAHRPIDENLTSMSACIALLSSKPALHATLKLAHAEKDYSRVAESPLIPTFFSANVREYLDQLRPRTERVVRGEKTLSPWSPSPSLDVDKDILRHIESLKLCCPEFGRPICSVILHELGSFKDDPVLKKRTSHIFTRKNKFLVNASGTGKTRLLYEGLCLNWGLYFTVDVDSGYLGTRDMEEAIRTCEDNPGLHRSLSTPLGVKEFAENSRMITRALDTLLLARLLIFQQFLETATADGLTEEHKKRWLLLQLSPSLLNPSDLWQLPPLQQLPRDMVMEENPYIHQDIADAIRKIRILLGEDAHLFLVIDGADTAAKTFTSALGKGKSFLSGIVQAWGTHTTTDHTTFIFSGIEIPKTVLESTIGGDDGYVWCSATGGFETAEEQGQYVSTFLPPAFLNSPSGALLMSRMPNWLLGRYRSTASFVYALLSEGLQTPHTRFDTYVQGHTRYRPMDALEQVIAEGRQRWNWQKSFIPANFDNIPPDLKDIFLEVLYRYMATHHPPPTFSDELIGLVGKGHARCLDNNLSRVTIDEPLTLVGAAVKYLPHPSERPAVEQYIPGHPNNYPETFLGSLRLNAPRSPQSFSHCLVFYLACIFSQPRSLAEVFNFPYKLPAWAKQAAQLVKFHRGNSLEVEHTVVDPDDYSAPLATPTTSLEDTISWLEHEHGTAFCLPSSSSPDLLFALQLADQSFVWVAMRAIPSTEPIPNSELKTAVSQLNHESIFDDEGADPSLHARALAALQALPNRPSKVGKHSLFRVVAAFPVEVDLEGSVNKRTRDAASLSLAALEGAEDEITQPAFFDSIVAGVLAGQKRKMSQMDEDAPMESRPKRQKTADPAPDGEAEPVETEMPPVREIASTAALDGESERATSPTLLKTKGKARARPDEEPDDPAVPPKKKSKASPKTGEEPGAGSDEPMAPPNAKDKGKARALVAGNLKRAVFIEAVSAPQSKNQAEGVMSTGSTASPKVKRGSRAQKSSSSSKESPARHTRSKTKAAMN